MAVFFRLYNGEKNPALTTEDITNECSFEIYGEPRTGKGVLLDTVSTVLGGDKGGYVAHVMPEVFVKDKRGRSPSAPSPERAKLRGRRMIIANEIDSHDLLDSSFMKQLTGGDPITARAMYAKKEITFTPVGKVILGTNYHFRVTDPTVFESDRLQVIPTCSTIPKDERDQSLKGELRCENELSAVFNWMLEGLVLYQAEGIKNLPPEVYQATKEAQNRSSILSDWANECLVPDPGNKMISKEIYNDSYKPWCEKNDYKPDGFQAFNRKLERQKMLSKGVKVGEKRNQTAIVGYALRNGDNDNAVVNNA